MKPSHLQTPRSLSECNFTTGYIQAQRRIDLADRIVLWGCLIGGIALLIIVLFVPEAK